MPQLEQHVYHGWELLRLITDEIVVDVVPALGGTVVSLRRRSDDQEHLWRTPWGLRNRGAWSLPGSSEAQMLDTYPGGWQTLFPNGGDTAIAHGVEWGHQGETRLTAFDWQRAGSSVIMKARLVRSPFEVTKIISVKGYEVTIGETIENVGGESLEVMWGHEIVFAPPLVSEGTTVEAAAITVHPDPKINNDASYDDILPWPRSYGHDSMINLRTLPGPEAAETRLSYLCDFTGPSITVSNATAGIGVDLEWDADAWPYVWYSLEAGRRSGFPWYRKGYFFSLTPSSSWPAGGLHDARRIASSTLWVAPEEARTAHLSVRVHPEKPTT